MSRRVIILLFVLSLFFIASAVSAQDATEAVVPPTPTAVSPDPTEQADLKAIDTGQKSFGALAPSFQTTVLSLVFIIALISALYMVFFFSRRLQSSAFLRNSLVDSVRRQELQILMRDLDDRVMSGPIDVNKPPPEGYDVRCLWRPEEFSASNNDVSTALPPPQFQTDDEHKAWEKEQADLKAQKKKILEDWKREERKRYNNLKKEAETQAAKRAQAQVPRSFDVSLLGGGFSFVLEFSTVIVIIFALLILAALDSIDGREVATILAAIAGYVLGKASMAGQNGKAATSAPVSGAWLPGGLTPANRNALLQESSQSNFGEGGEAASGSQ